MRKFQILWQIKKYTSLKICCGMRRCGVQNSESCFPPSVVISGARRVVILSEEKKNKNNRTRFITQQYIYVSCGTQHAMILYIYVYRIYIWSSLVTFPLEIFMLISRTLIYNKISKGFCKDKKNCFYCSNRKNIKILAMNARIPDAELVHIYVYSHTAMRCREGQKREEKENKATCAGTLKLLIFFTLQFRKKKKNFINTLMPLIIFFTDNYKKNLLCAIFP